MNKYHAKSVVIDGIRFASMKEGQRYRALMLELKAGRIGNLKLQPEFTLQEAFTTPKGERIRAVRYIADFQYTRDGKTIVEDVKGFKTKEYLLKRKLMQGKGFEILEI